MVGVATWRSRSRELLWKKRNLTYNEDQIAFFLGSSELSSYINDLETPFKCFSKFMTEDILNKIVEETNLYRGRAGSPGRRVTPDTSISQKVTTVRRYRWI